MSTNSSQKPRPRTPIDEALGKVIADFNAQTEAIGKRLEVSSTNLKRKPTKSKRQSHKPTTIDKPEKPFDGFPLTAHNSGAWMKKINGKVHYFGKWGRVVDGVVTRIQEDGNWKDALELFNRQSADLYAGRRPRAKLVVTEDSTEDTGKRVKDLCNEFLTAKTRKLESGEIGPRMFEDYKQVTDLLVASFGADRPLDDLFADDFEELRAEMAKRWGPVRLANSITRVKSVFKYGLEKGIIEKAARYGPEFKKPGKAVLRRHRAERGERMFEACELRTLIDAAPVPLKAFILLGVNCAYGNHDTGSLSLSALNLDTGWINFPRPKTGIARKCPLWPETVNAIRDALAIRPKAKDKGDAEIVFLSATGTRLVRNSKTSRTDNVAVRFGKLLQEQKIHRQGIGFYALRHTFRTIADTARDSVAIDIIMGHTDASMGANYRERVEDSRLQAVVNVVREWLWPTPAK